MEQSANPDVADTFDLGGLVAGDLGVGDLDVSDLDDVSGLDDVSDLETHEPDGDAGDGVPTIGYRGVTACKAAGITYRQLDYWARTNLVVPSVRDASGSGTQRLYSFRDIVVLRVVKSLLDAGVSLQNIRKAIATLRSWGETELATMTLISDGTTVYSCRSAEEVVDLLRGGQGVFGIAIGGAFKEIQGSLAKLPAISGADGGRVDEGAEADESAGGAVDELAARRARRRAS